MHRTLISEEGVGRSQVRMIREVGGEEEGVEAQARGRGLGKNLG